MKASAVFGCGLGAGGLSSPSIAGAVGDVVNEGLNIIGPRKDHRGVNLISDALPFDRLWYGEPDAISNAEKGKHNDNDNNEQNMPRLQS